MMSDHEARRADQREQALAVYKAAVEEAAAVVSWLSHGGPLARRVLQLQEASRQVTAAYLAWAALSEG